ncbi:MAG: hypothetical protein ACRDAM_12025, partial [Casimicrobium sp.]
MSLLKNGAPRRMGVSFACVSAIAASLVWFVWFLWLFPLSEFRDWLVFFEEPSVIRQTADNLFFRTTRYSRDFPLLYVAVVSNVCVDSLVCINTLAALPLLLATLLFFFLVSQFTGSTVLAALSVALWALSTPYLDTMAWQATILDRVGVCVAMFALLLVWRVPIARSATHAWTQALIFCVFVFASLNSKEAYWFVPIAVALAYVGRVLIETRHEASAKTVRVGWAIVVLLPMCAYSMWFAYRYAVATPFATNWMQHVSSGDVLLNLNAQSKNVFGFLAIGGIAITSIFFTCAAAFSNKSLSPTQRLRAFWLVALLILAYLPAARARFPATYYMLPVLAFVLLALAWWTSLVLQDAKDRTHRRLWLAAIIVVMVSGMFVAHLRPSAAHMRDRAQQSRAFITTHITPNVARDVLQTGKLCFEVDPRDPLPVLFVDSPKAYALLRWVAQTQDHARLREVPVWVNYPGRSPQFSAADCKARF